MAIRTWVGRFCVADGHVEEEGPWLGSLIRQRPDEEADELYVLIEPASPSSAEYTSQLVDVISQLYSKDPLSLTGALTRSLRAAHDHLREWNQRSLPEHQVGAGASCLALRGPDAYLAQVGPSVAYIRSASGDVRRMRRTIPTSITRSASPRSSSRSSRGSSSIRATSCSSRRRRSTRSRRPSTSSASSREARMKLCRSSTCCAGIARTWRSCCSRASKSRRNSPRIPDARRGQRGPGRVERRRSMSRPPPLGAFSSKRQWASGRRSRRRRSCWRDGRLVAARAPDPGAGAEITDATAPPPATGVRLRGDSALALQADDRPAADAAVPDPALAVFAVIALAVVGLMAYLYIPGSLKENREADFTASVAAAREDNARAQATSDPGLKRQLLDDAQAKLGWPRRSTRTTPTSCRCRPMSRRR